MSLIESCRSCGQRISLRKMRPGHWVAFDVGTRTPHKCRKDLKPEAHTSNLTDLSIREVPSKYFGKKLKKWMDQKRTSKEIADVLKNRGITPTIFQESVNNFIDEKKIRKAKEILRLLTEETGQITTTKKRTEKKDWAGEISNWGEEWHKEKEGSDNVQVSKSRLSTSDKLVILAILIAVMQIIFG